MCLDVVASICIGVPLFVAYKIVTIPYKVGTYLWRQNKAAVTKRQDTSSDHHALDFKLIRDQLRKHSICEPMFTDVESDSSTDYGGH